MLHLYRPHPFGTLVTYSGREYDLTRRIQVHELAAALDATDVVIALFEAGAGQDQIIHTLWQRILAAPSGALGGPE